jgi:putative oxidoreductase
MGTTFDMRPGTSLLRAVVGALFIGHGLQKLAGWFGGHGLSGTSGFFEQIGLRPGKVHATAAGVAETAGGALLMTGKATPVAQMLLTGTMTTAVEKVHWQKGIWSTDGGFEYNAVLVAAAFAIAAEDNPALAVAGLAGGVAGGLAVSRLAERMAPAPAPEPSSRFVRDESPAPAAAV